MKKIVFIISFISIVFICNSQMLNPKETRERIDSVKKATVRVLIDSIPSGTGFFMNKEGFIVTNMHVIKNEHLKVDTTSNTVLNKIEIEMFDGERREVKIHESFMSGNIYLTGMLYDFIVLSQITQDKEFKFLKLGDFNNVSEGDNIYTCGYPFGIEQSIVTTGIISTKFKEYLSEDSLLFRELAWLDLSMNKGNSGGAIILMTEKPSEDVVIGLASFNLNVLSSYAKQLKALAKNRSTNIIASGLDLKKFAELTAVSIEANSYGIGGMISINHLKSILTK